MKIRIIIDGWDIEKEAIDKVVAHFKERGIIEEAWEVAHEVSPFKNPIETPIEVGANIRPMGGQTTR